MYSGLVLQKLLELHHAAESGSVCVIVQGSSGCGKSTLLRSYAHTCGYKDGENLLVIHLGEQIDSKVYTCIYVYVCGYAWTRALHWDWKQVTGHVSALFRVQVWHAWDALCITSTKNRILHL